MSKLARIFLSLCVMAAISPLVVADAAAQSVATAEASAFIGDWDVALGGQAPSNIRVNISDNGGEVAAVVTGIEGNDTPVSDIKKAEEDLVLSYTTSIQGMDVPIVITLTPDGDGLNANVDVAGGMMTVPGTATKQ